MNLDLHTSNHRNRHISMFPWNVEKENNHVEFHKCCTSHESAVFDLHVKLKKQKEEEKEVIKHRHMQGRRSGSRAGGGVTLQISKFAPVFILFVPKMENFLRQGGRFICKFQKQGGRYAPRAPHKLRPWTHG